MIFLWETGILIKKTFIIVKNKFISNFLILNEFIFILDFN